MKVVEVRDETGLQELKPAWDTLLAHSPCSTTFTTWEWMAAWWRAYGNPGDLRVLAAVDESGTLRGLAPLRHQTARRYGQAVPSLVFLGDGSSDSDYLDFIVDAEYEQPVWEAFRRHWEKELARGTVLMLREIPETSPNLPRLKATAQASGLLWTEADMVCSTVRLPRRWEEYLNLLRPRFRTKVRSVLRHFEGRPEVRFGWCQSPEQIESLLPVLYDLHTRRWAQDAQPGVFGWNRKRDFYAALSPLLLNRGWLRFSWLEWKGRVLACQYGFVYGDRYFHLQEGYEPVSEHWNLGIGLRAWTIREFLKQGLREYDFLGGAARNKTDWGAETTRSKHVLLAAATYKNLLFCRGPEWAARVREGMKRVIPEPLLAVRRAHWKRRQVETFSQRQQAVPPASAEGWLSHTAARCYFHLGLPALVRPLREQYQLSILPNGHWPSLSWQRRKEPCARILFYHRVNDDRDPFFPAISTELFEQEMRFVARHYLVVSLAEVLDRLQEGAAGAVVAITFDDGYQDNYQNAFPVLQRLGLPATIFLTTGSLDSREPLWFELLAQELKNTTREFIDVELDLPRRLWLRTQAERLAANERILAVLRGMEDNQRRQWLKEILGQLGSAEAGERRDKMLTWDQVRLMKRQGIDFGGHTVTHPFLSRMAPEQVAWEVSECKRRIEQEVQAPVRHFAYPQGREKDFAEWNREAIARAGYEAAVTTIWGMNYPFTDRMQLRRGGPWEENPAMFAYKLDWYQLVND